ncbi:hypothetical protein DSL72_000739 [Monilinia vaccinii-corymbosi]|uniref:Glycosyl transferase CAP10 domain-containing protein n=1 Tax=Monilinia vaccinii-corymbosi TaxID=61207 RepID=A0A8A3P6E5_9HELO|nr:hypothetical protein DSL72_000739 [Monilinia vaccinii-corymbosi]
MAAYPGPPRRPGGFVRYILGAFIILLLVFYLKSAEEISSFTYMTPAISTDPSTTRYPSAHEFPVPIPNPNPKPKPQQENPIDTLIANAEKTFQELLHKESHHVNAAAAEYRKRRGRHPPPGFDAWFKFAQENNAVMVEDFFDQIYHDLGPYWGVNPSGMRTLARDAGMVISIRNGNATADSDWFWTQIWLQLIGTIQKDLPDMDIPLNAMDEPRMVVPWEVINEKMDKERATRKLADVHLVSEHYGSLPAPRHAGDGEQDPPRREWENSGPYWKIAVRGCHPDSLARRAEVMTDFSKTPTISMGHSSLHTYKGYVSNHSLSADFCHQPDLQSLHGAMINPLSISSTQELFPLFGGSKLSTNNEILLPAPMYWAREERFSGGDDHGGPWHDKLNKAIWRGVATGGRHREDNWKGFQRHRFVSMSNHTSVSRAESWEAIPPNFALPTSTYNIGAQQENRLGGWIHEWSDVGFIDLMCDEDREDGACSYADPYFSLKDGQKMSQQFQSKYIPDIDGNSFSGRYRGFLLSTSLPIKATIFREWHDSRLIPWKHFVPMDNRYMDFYGIMQYFLGYEGENFRVEGHDADAERIAMAGQQWANKVLRREDMQIYVMRLLLEYARVSSDDRANLGFVKDLL